MSFENFYAALIDFMRYEEAITVTMRSIGLVGSALLFLVYSRASLSSLSVAIYFRSMAVVCIAQNIFYLIFRYNKGFFTSEWLVNLYLYVSESLVPISVWLEVAANFDRLFAILFPLRFKFVRKTLFKCIVIASIVIYNMAIFIYYLLGYNLVVKILNITHNDEQMGKKFQTIMNTIDLVSTSTIPFILMLGFTIATFAGIVRAHRRVRSTPLHGGGNKILLGMLRRDIKFGITMLVLNFMFLIFLATYRVNLLVGLNPFDPETQPIECIIFVTILNALAEYYYFLNFYIQFVVNSLVRKQVLDMFFQFVQLIKTFVLKLF